jgi:uncharacterized protein YdbL (DUF1318 family)
VLEASLAVFAKTQKEVDQMLTDGHVGESLTGLLAPLPNVALAPEETALLKEVNDARLAAYGATATLTPVPGDAAPISAELPKKSAEAVGKERALRYQSRYRDGIFREVPGKGNAPEWTNGHSIDELIAQGALAVVSSPKKVTQEDEFHLQVSFNVDGKPLKDFRLAGRDLQVIAPEGIPVAGKLQQSLKDGVADFPISIGQKLEKLNLKVTLAGLDPGRELAIPEIKVLEKIDPRSLRGTIDVMKNDAAIFVKDPDSLERERNLNNLALQANELRDRLVGNDKIPPEFLQELKDLLMLIGRPAVD